MDIRSRYKDEVNSLVDDKYNVGGEEMLRMVKGNTIEVSSGRRKGFTRRAVLIPLVAAVLGMTAVTAAGAAGYGPMSSMFTKYFDDEPTERLAEEGYMYTAEDAAADSSSIPDRADREYPVMGETLDKDIFSARIIGVAGDTQSPQMLVDITVNDPGIAENSDMLGVYVLTLGADTFDTDRDSYFVEYGKGVKDEEIPNLYHVSVYTPSGWMTSGKEIAVDIVSIHVDQENDNGAHQYYREQELYDRGTSPQEFAADGGHSFYSSVAEYNVEMQFRFTIPQDVFKEAVEEQYEGKEYKVGEQTYRLDNSTFGAHTTTMLLDFDGTDDPATYYDSYDEHLEEAKTVAQHFVLMVDGEEYLPDIEATGVFCDTEGNCNLGIKDLCYISLTFPAIDRENASDVHLEVR